jgi:hypothetical protein
MRSSAYKEEKMKRAFAVLAGLGLLLIAYVVFTSFRPAQAADDGRVDWYSDGLRIGSDGTKITLLSAGTVTVAANASYNTATVTGAAVGDILLLSPAGDLATAQKFYGTISENTIRVTLNANPSSVTVLFHYVVLGL